MFYNPFISVYDCKITAFSYILKSYFLVIPHTFFMVYNLTNGYLST